MMMRERRPWLVVLIASSSCAAVFGLAISSDRSATADDATPAATPCAMVVATPEAVAACVPAGLGTPVAGANLVVTLTAASTTAGPVDLIVEVQDREGQPVEDATVEIRTRHLEMDHGVSTDAAVPQGDGRYLAEGVSMGMGGNWQAEIHIVRDGQPEVVVTFLVKLAGPTH